METVLNSLLFCPLACSLAELDEAIHPFGALSIKGIF